MSTEPPPWHAAFPTPRNTTPNSISRSELLECLTTGQVPGKGFLLVDLRRADFEGGTIKGAINLPAQSLHPSFETLYTLCKAAGVRRVIWWCGSSRGRGTRAAGWFDDLIQEKGEEEGLQSLTLEGGIKGWATAGKEYQELMIGYEKRVWEGEGKERKAGK